MVQPQTVILTGPTAVGKSSIAIEFALKFALTRMLKSSEQKIEIVNADSVCFYKEFNIGSAKPTRQELEQVTHHLIDVADPNENYHAGRFLKDCEKVLTEIQARGNRALIVGGSGFYLNALRLGMWEAPETSDEFRKTCETQSNDELFQQLLTHDQAYAKKIGPNDRNRMIRALEIITLGGKTPTELQETMSKEPDPRFELWVMDREKDELAIRMRKRVEQMLENGLIGEVKSLRDRFPHSKILHSVGYQQVLDYLDQVKPAGRKVKSGAEGLIDEITMAHRQLAKNQRTWFNNLNPNHHFILDRDFSALTEKLIGFYK